MKVLVTGFDPFGGESIPNRLRRKAMGQPVWRLR